MKNKIFIYLRRLIFVLITVIIVINTSHIFERKTLSGEWNYTIKVGGFKNEPRNTFDVLGFGSSHMYCTLNPIWLYKNKGIRSYVLATQQQPINATYYYIKESFKRQKPKVVILEALMLTVSGKVSEGVAHDAVDPFPNSINKLRMINSLNTEDGKENYYFNFLKYHTRWQELAKQDFNFDFKKQTDPMRGYVFLKKAVENSVKQVSYEGVPEKAIDKENEKAFNNICKLVSENGAELMLLIAPYDVKSDVLGYYKYLYKLAEKNNVKILDFNAEFNESGIKNQTDFYDGGHLNVYGAEKATTVIGDFLEKEYGIASSQQNDEHLWKEDLEYYNSRK